MHDCSEKKIVSLNDVKPGDLLTYRLIKEENLSDSASLEEMFFCLVDKAIMWAEGSDITHSALAFGYNTVIEATAPYVRKASLLADGFEVEVHRPFNGKNPEKVLEFIPPLDLVAEDKIHYAMVQSVMALLVCLFRKNCSKNEKEKNAMMLLIKVMLYPVSRYLDTIIPFINDKNKEEDRKYKTWFCSQLSSYCYNMTAVKYNDEDYRIKSPSDNPLGDIIIDFLMKDNDGLCLEKTESAFKDEKIEELVSRDTVMFLKDFISRTEGKLYACKDDELEQFRMSSLYNDMNESLKDKKKFSLQIKEFLTKVFALSDIDTDKVSFEEAAVIFQTAFIMPSDLENALEYVGVVGE